MKLNNRSDLLLRKTTGLRKGGIMKSILQRPGIIFFVLLITIIIFFSLFSFSQTNAVEPKKTIGVLISSDFRIPKVEGVKKGLEEYRLIEGETVNYVVKNANLNYDLLPSLAEELVKEHPDLIFVTGESEAIAAQHAAQSAQIPIVFVGVGSAKEMGLIESYNSPGKNITGIENYYPVLSAKRLEYFQRLLPKVKNIAVMYDSRITPAKPTLNFLTETAHKLNLSIEAIPVTSEEEIIQEIKAFDPQKVDGVMFLCSQLLESVTAKVSPLALEKRIPIMGVSEEQTRNGLLASYGMPYYEQGLQASRLIAKVLHGENAANIPVESPAKVEFILNMETAKKLGLTLDPAGLTCVTKFVR
jgi:putative tryptophan/tyrosine transport system substrate-binding protein